jgi:hypothetical protein
LPKRTPKFADDYLLFYQKASDAKWASTLKIEGYAINQWKKHIGHLRLDKNRRIHVDRLYRQTQRPWLGRRTVNLEATVFRNIMNRAIYARWITQLPTQNLRPIKSKPSKRRLFMAAEIDKLCRVAFESRFLEKRVAAADEKGQPLLNAQQPVDYIWLMRSSGARMSEALRLRWKSDLDWTNRQLTIGSGT